MLIIQRTAADNILRELQNNPDMWLQVVHILSNTQSLNTKFFALQSQTFNHIIGVHMSIVEVTLFLIYGLIYAVQFLVLHLMYKTISE